MRLTYVILMLSLHVIGCAQSLIEVGQSQELKVSVIEHVMPDNTNGGNYPLANTWQSRPWNNIAHDEIGLSIDTVSNSPWFDDYLIVVPAGKYLCHYNSVFDFTDDFAQMRIYNATDDVTIDMDLFMPDGDVPETGGGFFILDLDDDKSIMLQHISDGSNSNGFGDITAGTDPQWSGHAIFARITIIKIDQ